MGDTEASVKKSIDEAVRRGIIDPVLHAGPIEVMLNIARTIDTPGFPIVGDNRYDNVSIPTLLRYMQAMGMTVQEVKQVKAPTDASPLDKARAKRDVKLRAV